MRSNMIFEVEVILDGHIAWLNGAEKPQLPSCPYEKELAQKSDIVGTHRLTDLPMYYMYQLQASLGVLEENPGSTHGTIKILDHLIQLLPDSKGVVYGDSLTVDMINNAKNARIEAADDHASFRGITPGIQEWHRQLLLLQVC
jgi:hypothetical protein